MKAAAAFMLATAGVAQAGTLQPDFSSDPGGTGNTRSGNGVNPDFMTLLTNSQLTLWSVAETSRADSDHLTVLTEKSGDECKEACVEIARLDTGLT